MRRLRGWAACRSGPCGMRHRPGVRGPPRRGRGPSSRWRICRRTERSAGGSPVRGAHRPAHRDGRGHPPDPPRSRPGRAAALPHRTPGEYASQPGAVALYAGAMAAIQAVHATCCCSRNAMCTPRPRHPPLWSAAASPPGSVPAFWSSASPFPWPSSPRKQPCGSGSRSSLPTTSSATGGVRFHTGESPGRAQSFAAGPPGGVTTDLYVASTVTYETRSSEPERGRLGVAGEQPSRSGGHGCRLRCGSSASCTGPMVRPSRHTSQTSQSGRGPGGHPVPGCRRPTHHYGSGGLPLRVVLHPSYARTGVPPSVPPASAHGDDPSIRSHRPEP